MNELRRIIIIIWITSFIKFVFHSYIHFCLSLLLFLSIVHSNLYFTSYSDSKSIYMYIYGLTNGALTQKVVFLLCPIHLTFVTSVWFVHSHCSSTCLNTHMRIIDNEKKTENLKWDTRHWNSMNKKSNCRSFLQPD